MSKVPAWFERKFGGPFPVYLMPNLLARLRGTPARLEEILLGHSHDALAMKPEGKWSAQENAGHLLDLEPLWLARVEDFVAGREQLTPTDLQNRRTDELAFNERNLGEILAAFRTARGRLLARVNELGVTSFDRSILHPRLKTPMSLGDHLFFVAEHDDHHVARIWELLEIK